jgi:hypothetical protein
MVNKIIINYKLIMKNSDHETLLNCANCAIPISDKYQQMVIIVKAC